MSKVRLAVGPVLKLLKGEVMDNDEIGILVDLEEMYVPQKSTIEGAQQPVMKVVEVTGLSFFPWNNVYEVTYLDEEEEEEEGSTDGN